MFREIILEEEKKLEEQVRELQQNFFESYNLAISYYELVGALKEIRILKRLLLKEEVW